MKCFRTPCVKNAAGICSINPDPRIVINGEPSEFCPRYQLPVKNNTLLNQKRSAVNNGFGKQTNKAQ